MAPMTSPSFSVPPTTLNPSSDLKEDMRIPSRSELCPKRKTLIAIDLTYPFSLAEDLGRVDGRQLNNLVIVLRTKCQINLYIFKIHGKCELLTILQ